MKTIKRVNYKGYECNLITSRYFHGDRVALHLIDVNGEPVAVCSVNLDDPLGENEIFIKDYSENEGMADFLVKEGIVELTGERVQTGYVSVPKCRLLIEV